MVRFRRFRLMTLRTTAFNSVSAHGSHVARQNTGYSNVWYVICSPVRATSDSLDAETGCEHASG